VHVRISHCNGRFAFGYLYHSGATSIRSLLSQGITLRNRFCPMLYPVSRLTPVRPLREHCRFVIRLSIAVDRIDELDIPRSLKAWLKENPYATDLQQTIDHYASIAAQ